MNRISSPCKLKERILRTTQQWGKTLSSQHFHFRHRRRWKQQESAVDVPGARHLCRFNANRFWVFENDLANMQ